jgi:hypothetical protein
MFGTVSFRCPVLPDDRRVPQVLPADGLLLDFLPYERRRLVRTGFRLFRVDYSARDLLAMWKRQNQECIERLVIYDPRSLATVWVIDDATGEYNAVPCLVPRADMTLAESEAARRQLRALMVQEQDANYARPHWLAAEATDDFSWRAHQYVTALSSTALRGTNPTNAAARLHTVVTAAWNLLNSPHLPRPCPSPPSPKGGSRQRRAARQKPEKARSPGTVVAPRRRRWARDPVSPPLQRCARRTRMPTQIAPPAPRQVTRARDPGLLTPAPWRRRV